MNRQGNGTNIFFLMVLLLFIVPVCISAGCTDTERAGNVTLSETQVVTSGATGSFTGNWTARDINGHRLDMFPSHDFELFSASKESGDKSRIRGEWTSLNDTVCTLYAFLPSQGGVGMGYYSATGILDTDAGTLMICTYQSVEECRSGIIMVRNGAD